MAASLTTTLSLTAAMLLGQPPAEARSGGGQFVSVRIAERIVKHFDFDEPRNYEEMPMNWNRVSGPGYPRFLEARFDAEVGRTAPPSFRLSLEGGSIGSAYLAKDMPVHPSSDYRITGWIRSSGLTHARARLTGYFLDHALRKIVASERRSHAVGGGPEAGAWTRVTIDLPGGFEDAAWIGLACLVEQPASPARSPAQPRPIEYRDVYGTAWFDDITVLRLPEATLKFSEPGSVFFAGQPVECLARVADSAGAGLVATLEVRDADRQVLQRHSVPVVGVDVDGSVISLGSLPAGAYTARLGVRVGSREILVKERSFIRLNPDVENAAGGGRGFGIILDPADTTGRGWNRFLLRALGPGVAKVPLWHEDTGDKAIVRGQPGVAGLLWALRDLGIGAVATLEAPPRSLAMVAGKPDRSLIDVLASHTASWRPYLALILARHGPHIRAWQVGPDGVEDPFVDPRLPTVVANVRTELQPLIGLPDLVVPVSIQSRGESDSLSADVLSLAVPSHISAGRLAAQLAAFAGSGSTRRWATIRPPDAALYGRRSRLVEFAQRILIARTSGVEAVFVPRPWQVETQGGDAVVMPGEDFIVFRTLAQALGGLSPVARIWIDHGVHAWLFADESSGAGAIVTWADADRASPREVWADIGQNAQQLDPWANAANTTAVADGRSFLVGAMPRILTPVPVSRARLLAGFAVDEPTFQVAVEEHERLVRLENPLAMRLRGLLRLDAPPGWRVRPRRVGIDLAGGDTAEIEVSFRLPNNQAVGDYALVGRFATEDGDLGDLTLRAPLYVRTPGLDVSVLTRVSGRRLTVVQRIMNLTEDALNLRVFMVAPQTPSDSRLITNLAAGEVAVREYHIEDARHLAGRHIRLSVQQIGGPLRHNQVVKFE